MTDCKMGFTMDPPKLQSWFFWLLQWSVSKVFLNQKISSSSSMLAAMIAIYVPWILSPTVSSSSVLPYHGMHWSSFYQSFMHVSLNLSAFGGVFWSFFWQNGDFSSFFFPLLFCSKRASATHIVCVCVCVFSKFLQKTFFHRNLNSFLVEKVPNNFFSCNQQPHLKNLKITFF